MSKAVVNPFGRKPYPFIGGVKPKDIQTEKVIVCGTRSFENWELMKRKLDRFTLLMEDVLVITGGQKQRIERRGEWVYQGADYYARLWAEANWYTTMTFWPDWEKHGKAAGPIRNEEMAEYAAPNGYCIAFWDGESRGTRSMIELAKEYLPESHVRVILYED